MKLEDATRYVIRGRPGQSDRPSLPAGHPLTWGAITRDTVLDGAVYPHPLFLAADEASPARPPAQSWQHKTAAPASL